MEGRILETRQVSPAGGVYYLLHRRAGHELGQEPLHLGPDDARDRGHS